MEKKQSNFAISLLIFIAVFGITNIPNNYAAIGAESIFWFGLLILYFVPIALIIAEMASYDANTSSGISRWVEIGTSKKIAFICAWAYFIENIFYLPMLASRVPVFLSWIFADIDSLDTVVSNQGAVNGVLTATASPVLFTSLAFLTVVISVIVAWNFEKIFEKIGKYIGIFSLITAFGFIFLSLGTVFLIDNYHVAYPLSVSNVAPTLRPITISTLVWIIFAIGGVETIGSVVNQVENPNKRLPKIVTIGSILVIIAYSVGIIGLSFILSPEQLSTEALENAIPVMFAQLGVAYNFNGVIGITLLKFIMLIQVFITISALVLWLVATINVLFVDAEKGIFPAIIDKKNKDGKPRNAMFFTVGLIFIFLLISTNGSMANIYYVLYNMSTISMVVPFMLLIISYINFKRLGKRGGYEFIKNKTLAILVGSALLFVTCFAFIFGIIDLPSLISGDMQAFYSWLLTAGGGLLFFMLIGYFIYIRKDNELISSIAFAILFLISGLAFSMILLVISGLFMIDVIRIIKNKKVSG